MKSPPNKRQRSAQVPRLYPGVFLVALATLLFEIALVRILSFSIWYHFAYVVISTALLGFGASGTLLAVRPSIGSIDLARTLTTCSLASAGSVLAAVCVISAVPLHPITMAERPSQLLVLVLYQLLATAPFFFAGTAIGLALREAADRVDRLYFWDLAGAGLGCIVAVPFMNLVSPPGAALLAAGCSAAAAFVFAPSRVARLTAAMAAVLLVSAIPFGSRIRFTPAASKHMTDTTERLKMEPTFTAWTALFRTDLVRRGKETRFRRQDEWGLSSKARWPVQLPWGIVLHDATAGTPIYDLREGELAFLDHHVLSLPYLVANPRPKVLVIGVGGGRDVITAVRYGARRVTGVELDPVTVELIRDRLTHLDRGLFRRAEISLLAAEGRHFVKRSRDRFDVIQLTGVDTLAAAASGAYVLAENYLYTVEACHDYLDVLEPGGVLSIATGLWRPDRPRSAARMLNVARATLRERGVADPGRHIAVIHSRLLFAEVMVKNQPFSPAELASLSEKTRSLNFQPLLLGKEGHPLWQKLVGEDSPARAATLKSLPYKIDAIRDDSPFFFHFYRWRDLAGTGELWPTHTTALGQFVLALLLLSLTLFSAIFVLGPLFLFRRRAIIGSGVQALGVLGYFLAIGFGFMLFEISLIQRFILYLGYPTYSLSVVLFALLTSLGMGSYWSRRWVGHERVALPMAVVMVGLMTLYYMYGLPHLQAWTLSEPLWVRILITVAVLAPIGLTFGIFFPLGIRRAESLHRDLVAWAWGINGCASVTATVLAVVLAMTWGFQFVWILSLLIYALGVVSIYASYSASD